jgi:hypothetical protein
MCKFQISIFNLTKESVSSTTSNDFGAPFGAISAIYHSSSDRRRSTMTMAMAAVTSNNITIYYHITPGAYFSKPKYLSQATSD